mgnify:CR=1 FL=1
MNKNKIVFDNGYLQLHDKGLKDAFNRKIYLAIIEEEFAGLKYYDSEREAEKRRKECFGGYEGVVIQRVHDCIDITKGTYNKLKKLGYNIPEYYLREKWNPLY